MYISAIDKQRPRHITIDECMAVVKFCANEFFTERLQKKLIVFFDFNVMENKQIDGMCEVVEYNTQGPRVFVISLNRNSSRIRSVISLCHEMVHLKQYVYKQLQVSDKRENDIPITRWNGKKYKFKHAINSKMSQAKKFTDEEIDAYADLPWEKEAWKKQTTLARKYLRSV